MLLYASVVDVAKNVSVGERASSRDNRRLGFTLRLAGSGLTMDHARFECVRVQLLNSNVGTPAAVIDP